MQITRGKKYNVIINNKVVRQGELVMIVHNAGEDKYSIMDDKGIQVWHNEPMLAPYERIYSPNEQMCLF